jgi:hypothetical protein
MNTHPSTGSQTKLGLGSALAIIGALLIVLAPLMGWTSLPWPWDFALGFTTGLLAGMGTALAIGGLIERRRRG